MNFINRIFRRNLVECPRCLGKGKVDKEDIKRLKMDLFWAPGTCAYCKGIGKVPPKRTKKISADFAYLTTDLTSAIDSCVCPFTSLNILSVVVAIVF
ncbi:MAG: hypothetical protein BGP13_08550 [Sphingobacteriales bacterium 40-81]|nr:MAG: hypothetical protein BGP13_08550 [Sphingobacteriales bacterium 40-81]